MSLALVSNERIEKLIGDMMRPVFVSNMARAKLDREKYMPGANSKSQLKGAETSYGKAMDEIRHLLQEWRSE